MKWFSDFGLVVRSNLSTLREKLEDPERMLHQLIIDMEEELDRVRDSVAEAIADEIHLARQLEAARREVAEWDERARAALQSEDERAARAALEQKVSAESSTASLEAEHAGQKKETARLERSIQALEKRVRQARQKKTLLVARMARADAKTHINKAMDRATSPSAFAEFSRLESTVERREARSSAYDRLSGRNPEAEGLAEEFRAAEQKARLEAELDALKKSVAEEE